MVEQTLRRNISIYDLDRTVLRHATFTPFLIHCAITLMPLKVLLVPIWIGAMAFYKLGGCSREALKQFGLRLFLHRGILPKELNHLAVSFADKIFPDWFSDRAKASVERDIDDGHVMILATAAMEFYAAELGRRLGFAQVLATRHALGADNRIMIEGKNCYGAEKPIRVEALFDELGLERASCNIRFFSDSTSDGPLLDWVDHGVLVDAGARGEEVAAQRGWTTAAFNP
jgi:phosphatidylglycerophosphatase C